MTIVGKLLANEITDFSLLYGVSSRKINYFIPIIHHLFVSELESSPVDSNLTRNFGIKEPHFGGIQNNGEYCHSKDTEFYESLGDYTPFFEGLQEKDKSSKKSLTLSFSACHKGLSSEMISSIIQSFYDALPMK